MSGAKKQKNRSRNSVKRLFEAPSIGLEPMTP